MLNIDTDLLEQYLKSYNKRTGAYASVTIELDVHREKVSYQYEVYQSGGSYVTFDTIEELYNYLNLEIRDGVEECANDKA